MDTIQTGGTAADGAAADWVGEAAKRSDHKGEHGGSWWGYPATYALLAVNILVFAWMFPHGPVPMLLREHQWGAALMAQFPLTTLLHYGASAPFDIVNGATFGVQGQWWRLLTAAFVHVTVLHLVINMWCLWNLGLFGEPLLGKPGLVAVYVLTGVAGNLLSFAWSVFSRGNSVVAGASGAVFGIAGILIVLLSNRGLVKHDLTWAEIRGLRTQVIWFALANLALGILPDMLPLFGPGVVRALHMNSAAFPRVDNTAHLGGFLAGIVLGLPLFPKMITGKRMYRARQRATFAAAALGLSLFGYALSVFAVGQGLVMRR